MNPKTNKEFYSEKLSAYKLELEHLSRKLKWTSFLRLVAMIMAIWLLVKAIKTDSVTIGILSLLDFAGFLALVSFHKNLSDLRNKAQALIDINKAELKALDGDFSGFNNGKEYLDPEHEFTYDLDIFGERSIFQYLNRCCTRSGEKLLAQELTNSPKTEQEIKLLQTILREISSNPDMLEDYRATGMLIDDDPVEQEEIKKFVNENNFRVTVFMRIAVYLLGFSNISLIILAILVPGTINYLIVSAIVSWFFYGIYITRINRYHSLISKKQSIIHKYLGLSRIVAKTKFVHPKLQEFTDISSTSIKMLKQMDKLMNFLDTRLNLLVGVILNTLVLFDFHIIMQFGKWKKKYRNDLNILFNTHAEFDVLVSKGFYLFNNPEFVMPAVSASPLKSEKLGHPLIHKASRICNDIFIPAEEKVLIVTGANMAGKSTFLRAVGVNLILAGSGLPVCAAKFEFKPRKIITGMRTTDSLAESESYFFAELKRLQRIVKGLENGESYFVLLDEILKGTNSTDKHLGSEALIRQLTDKNATTILATHDLDLGSLEKDYPDLVRNYHFESLIKNNELSFDYKLKRGVAVNMNASFLMKKMGIIK